MHKKVVLIVIDACASAVVTAAMKNGDLPNMQALTRLGNFNPNCISIFPSITHAATTSIATGCYPNVHGIAGSHWYNVDNDVPVYYSSDPWVIMNRGVGEFFEDFAVKLNHQWLQTNTIFQTVEQANLKAACLNYLIYRGNTKHLLDVPQLLTLLPGVPSVEEVYGPSMLSLGDFITALPKNVVENANISGGLLHRFGLEDDYTADMLIQLAREQALPDFTLAYFPNNDYESHKSGPEKAVTTLHHFDTRLGELCEVFGGAEAMLQELCLVLTGDHSQSDVLSEKDEANIQLDELLADFSLAELGRPWSAENQLMVCPNLRMAQIYFQSPDQSQLNKVVSQLLSEPRIDQVMWRANLFDETTTGYCIAAADRGRLHVWPARNEQHMAVDWHGNHWNWDGDLSVVGGQIINDNRTLSFSDYPDAFERIKGGLECNSSGHVWLSARPGHEFSLPGILTHPGGGSHGSLHQLDSTVPLLVAGAPETINLPKHPRIVDVAPLCMSVLGIA